MGPSLVVLAAVLGLELAYDVAVGDALLYLAFEVGFAILPGWLLYLALSQRPGGWLRQLALGWGLGHALQVMAFIVTAQLDVRSAFMGYPVVVAAPSALAILRRRRGSAAAPRRRDPIPWDVRWMVGGVCALATALVALAYFPSTGLPGGQAVQYPYDFSWAISLAGDAKHHWPIGDPNVAGLEMPYHLFVHVHLAAASHVTGLPLPLVFFRLYTLPLIVLIGLQLVVAGQSLARSARAGVIAAALVLLVGQLNLTHDVPQGIDFLGVLPLFLYASPSIPFGLIMLLPLVVLVGEAIAAPRGETSRGDWVLIVLFMVGASDAKVIILPIIGLSLALYAGVHLVVRRRVAPAVLVAGALSLAVFAALYLIEYRGHRSGLSLDLSAGVRLFNDRMPGVIFARTYLEDAGWSFPGSAVLLSTGGVVLGALGLLAAQLVGLPGALVERRLRVTKGQLWLLSVLGTGLLVALVTDSAWPGSFMYFLVYGVVAGCILSADGLRRAWRSRPAVSRAAAHRTVLLALVGLAILAAAMTVPGRAWPLTEPDGHALNVLWAYGGLAAGLLLLVLIGGRWFEGGRSVAAWVVVGVVVVTGLLDRPIELARAGVRPVAAVEEGRRVTPELYAAMVWIRDNTPGQTVIAVNNAEALEYGYAAFTERRTFLGGWAYSLPVRELGFEPVSDAFIAGQAGLAGSEHFEPRVSLNDRAFRLADPEAISRLQRDHGVRYLLVDGVNGFPADLDALREVAAVVYEAPGVAVLAL